MRFTPFYKLLISKKLLALYSKIQFRYRELEKDFFFSFQNISFLIYELHLHLFSKSG